MDYNLTKLNNILRAPIDYCNPTVPVETEMVPCTNYKGQPVHSEKAADSAENLPFKAILTADSREKLPIHDLKSNDSKEKLPIQNYQDAYKDKKYSEPTVDYLTRIYQLVDTNQIFGSAYLVKMLGCSERTARNLMGKLREMDVLISVSGKGKGKYRFKYQSEL